MLQQTRGQNPQLQKIAKNRNLQLCQKPKFLSSVPSSNIIIPNMPSDCHQNPGQESTLIFPTHGHQTMSNRRISKTCRQFKFWNFKKNATSHTPSYYGWHVYQIQEKLQSGHHSVYSASSVDMLLVLCIIHAYIYMYSYRTYVYKMIEKALGYCLFDWLKSAAMKCFLIKIFLARQ